MGSLRKVLVGVLGALTLVGVGSVTAGAQNDTLVQFDSMTPITGTAVGAVNDRGIKGGGLAWAITSGSGEVDRQGKVEVQVTGLVIPALGKNPLANFSATVSCLTPHGVVNVTTGLSPASVPGGDSTINATVALPHPCKDPLVFVGTTNATTGAFAWFAVSNGEGDD
jgi:hypothetical protein